MTLVESVVIGAQVRDIYHDKTIIEHADPPSELPQAVQIAANNVVKVVLANDNPRHPKDDRAKQGWSGSGVALNNYEVLTAGHVVFKEKSIPKEHFEYRGDISVKSTTVNSVGWRGPTGMPLHGEHTDVDKFAGSNRAEDGKLDVALLGLKKSLHTGLGSVVLRKSALKPGDPVYFVNYQPSGEGVRRDPEEFNMAEDGIRAGYSEPAIYGGVTLKVSSGRIMVATVQKSYGAHYDTESRPGASGGALFDESGSLAGITSGERDYIVRPDMISVQPIDQSLVDTLRRDVAKEPSCKP